MYLAEAPNDKASKAITGGCTFSIIQLDSSNFFNLDTALVSDDITIA
jgi:hypothetical protein